MSALICKPCLGLPCDKPSDLASGIDGAIYSALDFSFVVTCPEINGVPCFCPPGLFPRTISILASVIPPVIPPINEPGAAIILRLQGCSALITRTLDLGATQDQTVSAAQSMQAEWAGQQSLCLAALLPGVNCNTATSIRVCNDAQTSWCGDVTAAGTFCQTLITTGLTESEIAAATALLKTNLNKLAKLNNCSGWLCPITSVRTVTPGVSVQNVFITNIGPETVDLTGLQYCSDNGLGPTCYPPSAPIPPTSIAPFTGPVSFSGAFSPLPVDGQMKNFSSVFFSFHTPVGFTDNVTLVVGC